MRRRKPRSAQSASKPFAANARPGVATLHAHASPAPLAAANTPSAKRRAPTRAWQRTSAAQTAAPIANETNASRSAFSKPSSRRATNTASSQNRSWLNNPKPRPNAVTSVALTGNCPLASTGTRAASAQPEQQ